MADSTADSITDKTNVQVDTDDEIFYPTVKEKRPGSLILQRQSNVVRDSVSSDEGESNQFGVFQFDGAYVTDFQYGERLARAKHERQHSIVDGLLCEIYDRWQGNQRDSFDSDTFTECSSTSEIFGNTRGDWERRHARQLHRAFLETKDVDELQSMVKELKHTTAQVSARLIRQLKRKDRRIAKLQRNCDIVTAIIQAASLKRRIDTRMKFSLDPPLSASAFEQWKDAMKAVARLPLGIPDEFRKKAWLNLADEHIRELKVDWEKTVRFAFNEKSNPDDNKLGLQIVKDLHRTGCTGFSGQDNEQDRAVLKRVLLAYARWNKQVGYCQGFNVIAALLLDVMGRKEDDALKVMIYLIDHVLPDSYFDNNLRALSVDMAVFRDLLRWKYPKLSKHLNHLQQASGEKCAGPNYEPPLTNVFTMQWFLTLFATCLPKHIVLRVWDSILLEGSEILLRTALVIWGKLSGHILGVSSADEFYTVMGYLCQDLMDGKMVDADDLIKTVYAMAQFPFPQLEELREKYTYNITPFSAAVNAKKPPRHMTVGMFSDDDDWDDEDIEAITCFTGIFQLQTLQGKIKGGDAESGQTAAAAMSGDISSLGPGAYGADGDLVPKIPAYIERMTTDMGALKKAI
ncbi:TBC1 domain family member 30-like [Liolophura sinensis]|uniref:TBC1 domain family member 30-like n=1 Tax=Liolophura sinensis TaxID=3198878 RepID=UPI003157FD02